MRYDLQGIYAEDLDGYPLELNTDMYMSKECKHIGLAALAEARHDLINLGIGSEPTEGLHVFDLDAYEQELKKDARCSFALARQYKIEATHQYKDNCECRDCVTDRLIDYGLPVKDAFQLSYLQETYNKKAA